HRSERRNSGGLALSSRRSVSHSGARRGRSKPSQKQLTDMIAEATVDCYNEDEAAVGFFTMIEDQLRIPFKCKVLGLEVVVEKVTLGRDGGIEAICRHGSSKQRIPLLELRLPVPAPAGSEWVEAYRQWSKGC